MDVLQHGGSAAGMRVVSMAARKVAVVHFECFFQCLQAALMLSVLLPEVTSCETSRSLLWKMTAMRRVQVSI